MTTLLKDSDWARIDHRVCLVTEFTPMARIENGQVIVAPRMPYASVRLTVENQGQATGFITHKTDFAMLWAAFKDRAQVPGARVELRDGVPEGRVRASLGEDEEVWLVWTRKHYSGAARFFGIYLFSSVFPKLIVMVCRKGAFTLLVNPGEQPDLQGEARATATLPLIKWTPEVMER